jgi:CHAT domain-containing protein
VLRTSARGSLRRSLERLDRRLVAPLDLPDAPVVLLPPGRLASLTWAGLPSLRGRPLTTAPSASTWLGAHARYLSVPGPVVAVAGPGLRRAEAEVDQVARSWPGCQTLRSDEATVHQFLSGINGAQLVHVAAHGRHQRENPLFSSIRLADGPVVGYDLDRVPDPPQQVVLSACDLGQATVRPGEEALGLTRAFLHSGSSTVISGVAKVSDRGAADLMADYHRRLAGGAAPAYALAEALEAADEPTPFACFGAGW